MRMQSACHVQLRVSSCSLQGRHADAGTTSVPKTNNKPQPIFLATSALGGTVATGSLCLRNGNKVVWLHGVHCDPSATQNLLSVSAAIALGFSFETNDRGEYVALHGPDGHFVTSPRKGVCIHLMLCVRYLLPLRHTFLMEAWMC